MNEEELKAGERYNFMLLYTGQSINNKFRFESPTGIHYILGLGDMEAVSPVLSPKYDPCRLFKKGDIVRLREYNGRKPYDYWHKQVIKNFGAKLDTVLEDEKDSGNVDIFQDAPIDELTVRVNSCHLELVTPVDELEPYSVGESTDYFSVDDREGEELSIYWKNKHPHAKEAAEAECKRLNEEYGKEQNNG